MRSILFAVLLVAAAPASAQVDEACPADLAAVDASFDETLQRLNSVTKDDTLEVKCDAIRHHIEVMRAAGDVFDRCTTGHGREENLGQVMGTIADFQDIASQMGCP
jgi:hypothetical protein